MFSKSRRAVCSLWESYIDGLMDGEAVQAWQQGELTEEILELRRALRQR